ncbi:MAG: DNA polymerase [Patescibacteria group bacterium]
MKAVHLKTGGENIGQNKKSKASVKRLVLLDAHAIIHRAYHALPDFSTRAGEPTGGLYGVAAMLIKIINELKPDYIIACYDLPKPTFRHDAYEGYKAGRAKAEDALVSQIIRSRDIFAAFDIPIYEKEGFEADDILGTIVEKLRGYKDTEIIIASGDMDTLQLVDGKRVRVYTLRKGLTDVVIYDEPAVKKRFGFAPKYLPDFKGLRGDPSDNIIGISGIGEKTATTLMLNFGSIEEMYKKLKKDESAFEKAGIKPRIIALLKEGEEEAEFSKTLATIRRDAPITFEIPRALWKNSFDIKKVEELFSVLEFRALLARVKQMAVGNGVKDDTAEKRNEDVDESDIRSVGIALWVLRSDITTPTLEDILQYAKTNSFAEAKEKILAEVRAQGLDKVYEGIELPIVPIIKKTEQYGVKVDVAYLKELSTRYHKELSRFEGEIWRHAGGEFNINSPKQLGEVLFDKMGLSAKGLKKTAGGARSTRESELAKLKGTHKIIDSILAYRELQKLLSTYIDNIPEMVDKNGRLHTTLNQAGTTTGRFSSSNPNLQNIPAHDGMGTEVRNAFVAEGGSVLVGCDYSQIEMRVLAALSGDETLTKVFQEGGDVHTSVASRVFGVKPEEVIKDMRRVAKVVNFGIIYGMGVNALKENLGGTRVEAQEFYNNYFNTFPKIAKYFENVKKDASKKGYAETMFGRRRHFEGIDSKIPYIKASAERQAGNAPLQGTAADIIKIAMKKADDALINAGLADSAHLILQVHDELIYEVKAADAEKAAEVIKKAMEIAVEFPIPLTVNVSTGKKWGELK